LNSTARHRIWPGPPGQTDPAAPVFARGPLGKGFNTLERTRASRHSDRATPALGVPARRPPISTAHRSTDSPHAPLALIQPPIEPTRQRSFSLLAHHHGPAPTPLRPILAEPHCSATHQLPLSCVLAPLWTVPSPSGMRRAMGQGILSSDCFPCHQGRLHTNRRLWPWPNPTETLPSAAPAQHSSPSQPLGASTTGLRCRHQHASSMHHRRGKPIPVSLHPRFHVKTVPRYLLMP
jgi:hypothetical protein